MTRSDEAPAGLWRTAFELPAAPPLAIIEALEESALSVSLFEIESDDDEQTSRWRVELLRAERPELADTDAALRALLAPQGLVPAALEVDFLAHQDWLSKAAMPRPALAVGRFYVHGENDPVPPRPGRIGLRIDAGMAFGSGEHGSTSGCLSAFDRLLRRRRFAKVLDMGCGSAILGIAAAKACRARMVAADNDPIAVDIARRNCAINGVAHQSHCIVSDGYAHHELRRIGPFDLIFANILADPLCAMAPGLKRHLARGGHAILAGLLDRQADKVVAAHHRQGLRLVHAIDKGPWRTLVLKRSG